mmetsp:Transcript_22893/g.48670  ORF Transcript_22893/g.48670 Transcript_22893/m.48670 type:complete len:147 (-) Transcript_22893:309-749(-)
MAAFDALDPEQLACPYMFVAEESSCLRTGPHRCRSALVSGRHLHIAALITVSKPHLRAVHCALIHSNPFSFSFSSCAGDHDHAPQQGRDEGRREERRGGERREERGERRGEKRRRKEKGKGRRGVEWSGEEGFTPRSRRVLKLSSK